MEALPHRDTRRFAKQQPAVLLIRTQNSAVGNEVRKLRGEGVKVITKAAETKVGQAHLKENANKTKGGAAWSKWNRKAC